MNFINELKMIIVVDKRPHSLRILNISHLKQFPYFTLDVKDHLEKLNMFMEADAPFPLQDNTSKPTNRSVPTRLFT